MSLGFKPLGARVLVEKYKEERQGGFEVKIGEQLIDESKVKETKSGLFIAEGLEDQNNIEFLRNSGKILVMGTGLSQDAMDNLEVGKTITFKNPHAVNYKGVEYYLVHENNIDLILD